MFSKFVDNLKTVLSIFGDNGISKGTTDENRFFRRRSELSQNDVSRLYLKSNVIQRMVETIPQLAMECEIIINSDSEDKLDKEKLQKRFRDWDLKTRFFDATVSARIYKESYLVLDIDDSSGFSQPINWAKCKGLKDILFIEFGSLEVNWNEQDTERISYTIRKSNGTEITIHPERVLLFSGKKISPKMQSYNGGSHQSQIESSIESYNAYVQSINESNNLLARLVTFVFKMNGLRNYLTADPINGIIDVQTRLREHKASIGGLGGLCIDGENEEVDWVSYSLAGVPEVVNKSKEFFIASTELTHDQLMNEGSHDTASELESKNTQFKIKSFIRENWLENLNTICQVITCEFYNPELDVLFGLELPEPSLSQLETVTAQYTQAQTDNLYFTMGVLNQETLQESRFASSTPWEINLINPGVFPKPVAQTSGSQTTAANKPSPTNRKKTTDSLDFIDNFVTTIPQITDNFDSTIPQICNPATNNDQFVDSVTPLQSDFQITAENLEAMLNRVKQNNPLVFAFLEAEEDNSFDP